MFVNFILKWKIEIFYSFSTLRIFHTPHFPHSAFSTLLIFHTPHFPHPAFSTLLIFHTPHSALGTPRFPPNQPILDHFERFPTELKRYACVPAEKVRMKDLAAACLSRVVIAILQKLFALFLSCSKKYQKKFCILLKTITSRYQICFFCRDWRYTGYRN